MEIEGTYYMLMQTSQQVMKQKDNGIIWGFIDHKKFLAWRNANAENINKASAHLKSLQVHVKKDADGFPIKIKHNGEFVSWEFNTIQDETNYNESLKAFFSLPIMISIP